MNEIINNYPIPRTIEDTLFAPQPVRIPITNSLLSADNWEEAIGDNWEEAIGDNWDAASDWENPDIITINNKSNKGIKDVVIGLSYQKRTLLNCGLSKDIEVFVNKGTEREYTYSKWLAEIEKRPFIFSRIIVTVDNKKMKKQGFNLAETDRIGHTKINYFDFMSVSQPDSLIDNQFVFLLEKRLDAFSGFIFPIVYGNVELKIYPMH